MTDTVKRGRRGALVLPLLGAGIAAWVVHRRLGERRNLEEGWHALPPAGWPLADAMVPVDTALVDNAPVDAAPAAPQPAVPDPVVAELVLAEPESAEPEPELVGVGAGRAVPAAAAVASVAAQARPDVPGSLAALADGSSPDPAYGVKGKSATKIFHAPGGAYYTRTRADVWFRSADDARAAGFTERARRHTSR
jgi:hypothetical protein